MLSELRIAKNRVVTLSYKVKDIDGNLVDDGHLPFVYLHGKYEGIFPEIEKVLEGRMMGDNLSLNLPKDAFGEFDDDLVLVEDADLLPNNITLGSVFQLRGEELILLEDGFPLLTGAGMVFKTVTEDYLESMIYIVTDIDDGKVVLNGNHPLAASELSFDISVMAIRHASPEEIIQGHAHRDGFFGKS